jgi:hypothetical protein
MAHAQKPDFAFRRNGVVRLNRWGGGGGGGGGGSSVGCWQASRTHQPAEFVLLVRACVLQSRDAYWLPTPFSCFPFTSPVCQHISTAVYHTIAVNAVFNLVEPAGYLTSHRV